MVLQLDARVPSVWRDPFSLQFGVDPARVVLREVSSAEEHMISALTNGISRSGLSMVARASGAAEPEVVRLLDRIGPLLLPEKPRARTTTVAIVGTGPTVERIARAVAQSGHLVEVSPTAGRAGASACDFGIAVGHYVLEPESYGFWLRRDLPHLPVIFGDGVATIGPLVEPGRTPCLYCLEHFRRDADPSWAAIAAQLWGRRSSAETPLVSREIAALASRIAIQRLSESRPAPALPVAATSLRLDVESGKQTRRDWMPHPSCGCLELPMTGLASHASGNGNGNGNGDGNGTAQRSSARNLLG
jgi:bacteriocin biosynthesis cyclodehydratase domain-containing protein